MPMGDRRICRVLRKADGTISYLLGPWGQVALAEALTDLATGERRYVVAANTDDPVLIAAAMAPDGKGLVAIHPGDRHDRLQDITLTAGRG